MARRFSNNNLVERIPQNPRLVRNHIRPPFWYSTPNYYILAVAISVAIFFVIWGLLNSFAEETPWITAGVISSFFLIFAVVLREFILRRNYQNRIIAQRQLDFHLQTVYRKTQAENSDKLTIEKNAVLVNEIQEKSKAAQVLGRISEAHFEVFEMCNVYLEKNEQELESITIGSPRLPVLRKSQEKIRDLHKFHLLNWASMESQSLVKEAKIKSSVNEKLEHAQRALNVLLSGIQFYPEEENLVDSLKLVKEFIVSIKVSHWMEQAERSAFKGNYKRAINHYRDALFFLARENERSAEHELIATNINLEIEKLREKAKNIKLEE
ncbi:MAG: hypothetical protein K1X72_25520 [Pyrinomonadaceae bacterium]|nr:hypothetical protein [Pyrinomonadaceae bacterium]